MRLQSIILIFATLAATASALCWTSPLGMLLGRPPRVSFFGPPARPGQCNLPIGNGGVGKFPVFQKQPAPPPAPPAPARVTVTVIACTATACTATVSACTATACIATTTQTVTTTATTTATTTETTTAYSVDPVSIAAGSSVCASRFGAARPTPLFNGAGRARCCAPIYELSPAGVVLSQCLG